MIERLKIFVAIALASCVMCTAKAQGSVVFRAKMDSAILLMGKQTALHLEISQNKEAVGRLTCETSPVLTERVEVVDRPEADTVDLGNNRVQINRDLILQSFDSGVYVIPPLEYVVGRDTFRTNQLTLKVLPVQVDSMTGIHDYKPIEGLPFNLLDFLPSFIAHYWWIYLLLLVLVGLGLWVYFRWIKNGKLTLKPQKPEIPPYEEAIQSLNELKQRQLWQSGQEKAYYTGLTDILRRYIYRRFGVNAVEMTTSEILASLKTYEEAHDVNKQLGQILEIADFVKFAKLRPLSDENEVAYQRALNFVETTKPAPQEADESEVDDKAVDKKEDEEKSEPQDKKEVKK